MPKQENCSPGEHPHSDQPNFRLEDYLQMVRDGAAKFSIAEAARVMGVSRTHVHRMMTLAMVSDEEFEAVLDELWARGFTDISLTAAADAVKRRLGTARTYVERCPHCGGPLRVRRR